MASGFRRMGGSINYQQPSTKRGEAQLAAARVLAGTDDFADTYRRHRPMIETHHRLARQRQPPAPPLPSRRSGAQERSIGGRAGRSRPAPKVPFCVLHEPHQAVILSPR
jgi:hypothetical protein